MTSPKSVSDYSDDELLSLYREGSNPEYAFHLMVLKYQRRVYWLVRRMVVNHDDTDDLVQNVFVKVWKALPRFRAEAQLYTWIYRISVNEALSFLKRRRFMRPLTDVENTLKNLVDNSSCYSGDEISKKLQRAVLSLPNKQRLVFNLKYFENMSYEDMSEILKTSVGALKASYHHAVKKIESLVTRD